MRTLSNELVAAIKLRELMLKLIWVGIFPSFGIYVFVAWNSAKAGHETAVGSSPMLPVAVLLALFVLVLSFVLRWLTLSPRGIANMLKGKQTFWLKMISYPASTQVGTTVNQEVLDALKGDELKLYEYSAFLFNALLIQWGMVNTCALFGMILPPLQYQPVAAITAGVLSAACMLLHFPSIQRSFAAGLELADFEQGMSRD